MDRKLDPSADKTINTKNNDNYLTQKWKKSALISSFYKLLLIEFDQQALHAHNMFRKIHGVPAMSIDAQMSADAAKYAQIIAQRGGLSHSSRKERNGDGENLAMKCSSGEFKYTGDLPVAAWYARTLFFTNFLNTYRMKSETQWVSVKQMQWGV